MTLSDLTLMLTLWGLVAFSVMYTSRSAAECFQRCPRRRYWEYLYKGRGLRPIKGAIPLVSGIATHRGLEVLMGWLRNRWGSPREALGAAILKSKHSYAAEVRGYKTALEKAGGKISDDERFTYFEQVALVEALLRGFAIKVLPHIARRYEVVMVEQEEQLPLTKDLTFEARIDAVVRDKLDDSIYLVNFKTANAIDTRRENQIGVEMQGLTESYVLQRRLDRQKGGPARVSGVLHVFLIKGKTFKQKDRFGERKGRKETYSPLVRPFRMETENGLEYAHTYPRGRGWRPFYVWECKEVGGVAGWIRILNREEVQPELGDVLGKQFYIPLQQFKDREEIVGLMREVYFQEVKIQKAVSVGIRHNIRDLEEPFPMRRHSCYYPTTCPFTKLCFNPVRFEEPMATGEFGWRVPHHKGEREAKDGR